MQRKRPSAEVKVGESSDARAVLYTAGTEASSSSIHAVHNTPRLSAGVAT